MAFQDGQGGSWQQWSPSNGNIYDFPVTDGGRRYGVAFHRQESDDVNTMEKVYVIHATVAELASLPGTNVDTLVTTGLSYTPDPTSLNGAPVFRAFQIDLDQSEIISHRNHWQIKISAGWLGTDDTYSHPDFSGSDFVTNWNLTGGSPVDAMVSTATTQENHGGLSLVIRKTLGRNSKILNPDSWVIAQKLSHNDKLRLDIAREFSTFEW